MPWKQIMFAGVLFLLVSTSLAAQTKEYGDEVSFAKMLANQRINNLPAPVLAGLL